jgi:predicted MFS family arabinose efflux permease
MTVRQNASTLTNSRFFLAIFVPFGCAYLISYGLRTVNAAIAPQLTREFGLDAAQLGFLTAAYFLAFAFTQLPLGSFLDRYRPRRVEAVLMLICAAGCFVFATATSATGLIVGRALIGIGVAACLMATLRTFGLWLAKERVPAMNGYMLAVGNAGAILSTAPVLWALGFITWSHMFAIVGVFSIGVAMWLAFVVPDPPGTANQSGANSPVPVSVVLRSPLFWAVAPITCFTNAMGLAVQGLWAGPWLVDVGGMSPRDIGGYLLLISAGMFVSNLLLGMWLGRIAGRGGNTVGFASVACIGAAIGLLPLALSWSSQPALWLTVFGLTHVAGNLMFAALTPKFPPGVAGRLSTIINFMMFSLGFVLQWCIGLIVNRYPTDMPGRYATAGYETAFILVFAIELVLLVWTFFALRRLSER